MALNDIPSKRFKPKAPAVKFNWVGDPADRLRGKGDAITGDQSQSMLAFNRNLTEPLDRGGGSAIRINGAPVSLAGTGTQSIGRQQPWQQTTSAQAAAIAARYSAPPNPNLISPTPATPPAPAGAPTAASGPSGDPGASGDANIDPQAGAWNHNAPIPGNPNLAPATPPVDNPNDFLHSLADGPDSPTGGITPPFSTLRDDPLKNPITGAPVAGQPVPPVDDEATRQADFLAKGGSLAQFHQSEVAKGLRPPIDARTRPDPLGSTASADIRKSMGFGATPQETAANIAGQMTNEFNSNHAAQQDAWRQKFTNAHDQLIKSLQQDN